MEDGNDPAESTADDQVRADEAVRKTMGPESVNQEQNAVTMDLRVLDSFGDFAIALDPWNGASFRLCCIVLLPHM